MTKIRASTLPYLHIQKFENKESIDEFLESLDYGTIIVYSKSNHHTLIKQGFEIEESGKKSIKDTWCYLTGSHRNYNYFLDGIIQIRQDLMSMINLATFAIHKQNTGLIINELGTVFHA